MTQELTSPGLSRRSMLMAGGAAAIFATVATAAPARAAQAWANPAVGVITSRYGYRYHPITNERKLHRGTDIAQSDSSKRTIRAAAAGTVLTSGWDDSFGNYIRIRHADGTVTLYAHLASRSVSAGATVAISQAIGVMGTTGSSTGVHLHFEVHPGGDRDNSVDPEPFVKDRGIVLGRDAPVTTPEPVDDDPICFVVTANGANSQWLWSPNNNLRKILNPFEHNLCLDAGAVERLLTMSQLVSLGGS